MDNLSQILRGKQNKYPASPEDFRPPLNIIKTATKVNFSLKESTADAGTPNILYL